MPYKTDKEKLGSPFLKKSVRLLPCQKEMIGYWHKKGYGIRALARMFHVDKRTIQFILFPERLKRNIELRHERGGTKAYYKRDKHNAYMKKHRSRKSKVLNPSAKKRNTKPKTDEK